MDRSAVHGELQDELIVGDHGVACYVEITKAVIDALTTYTIAARRNVLSGVIAMILAASIAESGRTDVLDDSLISGSSRLSPSDVFTAISTKSDTHSESLEVAARTAAERLGATALAQL